MLSWDRYVLVRRRLPGLLKDSQNPKSTLSTRPGSEPGTRTSPPTPADHRDLASPRRRRERGRKAMRKRERENPCGICGHYHKYEEGEVCGVCGHRWKPSDGEGAPARHESAFPTEVLKDFLFLGSYDNASRSEVLRTLSITHILNVRI